MVAVYIYAVLWWERSVYKRETHNDAEYELSDQCTTQQIHRRAVGTTIDLLLT